MTVSATSPPLARVQLARDARTTLAIPALLVLLGVLMVGVSLVLLTGPPMFVLAGVGLVLTLVGVALAVRIRSLRLAVETDYLHLTGIRVDRRYHLVRGDLSRVASSGIGRIAVRPGTAALGFAAGRATLGGGERVEVIRLGATPSVILVPTERGRVAIASAAEGELIAALMAAARTRAARPFPAPTTEVAAGAVVAAPEAPVPAAVAATVAAVQAAVQAPVPAPAPAPAAMPLPRPVEPAAPPRPMTGIERMELEERLAFERRAALTGARDEQAAASLTASAAAMTLPGRAAVAFPPVAPTVPAPAAAAMQPAVAAAPAAAVTTPIPIPATAPAKERAIPRALPRRRPQRPMARRIGPASLGPDIALLGGPLAAAAVVWALAVFVGSRPAAAGLDPIGAALLLCGPIAVLAAWLARSRWPRLAGLTSIAAVISLALVARALIG